MLQGVNKAKETRQKATKQSAIGLELEIPGLYGRKPTFDSSSEAEIRRLLGADVQLFRASLSRHMRPCSEAEAQSSFSLLDRLCGHLFRVGTLQDKYQWSKTYSGQCIDILLRGLHDVEQNFKSLHVIT